MTKAKRFLSAVMAVVMVMTMLSCLGVVASAYVHDAASLGSKWVSETDPGGPGLAQSYSSLSANGKDVAHNTTSPWVYNAIEIYELLDETVEVDPTSTFEDDNGDEWTITDHYVQPDQILLCKRYIKGNVYGLTWQDAIFFDRSFFDILSTSGATKGYKAANDKVGDGLYNQTYKKSQPATTFGGTINDAHPYFTSDSTASLSSDRCSNWSFTKGGTTQGTDSKCGLNTNYTWYWDALYTAFEAGIEDTDCQPLFNDQYLFSFKIKVRSDEEPYQGNNGTFNPVPDGAIGHIGIDNNITKISGNNSNKFAYIEISADEVDSHAAYMCATGSVPALDETTYMTEDCNHTFKIGNPPAAGEGYTAKFFDGATEYTALEQTNATTITLPAAQTKEGYTFGGWNDGTNTYAAGASYTLTANTNFAAVWNEITYSIKYFDGASEYTSLAQSATYTNNIITLPAAQAKAGFRFDGWSDGTNTYAAGYQNYTVTADTNFSAVWTQLYTATFEDEDGTPYGSVEYAAGEAITFPTVTAREGYVYSWDPALTTMPSQNQTFILRWTAAGSSINFETNGGSYVAPITGAYGDPVTAPTAPTKTGYTFAGWFTDVDCTPGNEYSFSTMPATAITLYAKWTANTYNANFYIDGETTPYETVSATYGSTFTAPALPSETGYSFSAWTPSDFVMNAEGRDYYTTKTANSYIITFKDRDGNVLQSGPQTYGNALQLANAPEITGEPFSGWTGDDGSFIAADATGVMVPARNTIYTATYNQTLYTLTYYVDGEVVHTDSYAYNAPITPYNYTAPTGKTVSAWEDANNQPLKLRMPEYDYAVYATTSWIEYTLSFLNKDGSVFASVPAHYGQLIEELEPATDPTVAGYAFAGWDYVAETVTGDLSIPGIWNALSYNVEFVYGEPATSHAGGAATYGTTISSATFPDATVEGKSYVWQYEGANVGSSFAVPALPAGSTITFIAVYSAQTYTIEYQVNGSRVATESYAYGATITPRDLPTETGYDVSDWTPALPGTMPAENLVVNCTKTPHVYTDTWYDYDGTVMTTTQVAFNATIVPPTFDPNNYPGIQGLQWSPTPGTQDAQNMEFYLVGSGATVDVTVNTIIQKVDGSGYDDPVATTISGITGRTIDISNNASLTQKTGFTLNQSASTLSATVAGDGTTTLTVVFDRNKYQINVTDDGNTSVIEYYYQQVVEDLVPAGKTGYSFDSWTWTRTSGASATQPATMPAYNLNAVAKYTVNKYIFTTYIDGVENTSVEVTYNTAVNAPAAQTREGYTFDGWYSTADFDPANKVTFPFNMPAEAVNVYARFVINTYTYTFNTDGGTEIAPITAEYGTAISVANPVKEGYTFKAWSPALPATMGAGDQTFTAIYQINNYTVTFKNGDAIAKTVTAPYGAVLAELAAPTVSKTGYTFTGWTYADGEGVAYEGTTIPAYNLVATAQFDVNSYAAVFYAVAGDAEAYTTVPNVEFDTTFQAPACTKEREYYTFAGWSDGNGHTYQPGDEITMDTEGKTFTGVWEQDTSACRVASVVRVTEGYYQLGVANYDVTLVAGIHPDTLIIDTGADGIFYLARMEYEVGRTQMIKNIRVENDQEIWTVALSLAESQNGAYGAYCEVDGVEDSPFKFDVTYDIKDAAAIAADFTSADISGLTAVRGDVLTWTVTTSTKVAWLKFVGTYTDGAGAEQELVTYYKASNYRDGDGVETAKVTDADGVRTWVIPMMFNYPGNEDLVVQTWNIQYRCTGSSVWETGVVSDGNDGYVTYAPQVTVAKKAEALEPAVENYDKYELVSVETNKTNAVIGDTITFVVVTTEDVSKIRISFVIVSDGSDNGKTKSATYQTTSTNVTNIETANGLSTWTIAFKVNKVAQNGAFDVQCRGLNWGDAQTATVAISA